MGTNRSEGGGGYTVHLRLIEIVKYNKPEPNGINLPTPQPPPPPHPVSLYVCEKTLPQYAYSPYCSAYISLSVDKENFWQTRTSLVGNHFLFYSCDLTKWVRGVTIRENSRPTITPCKGQKVNRAACIESPDNWVCSILDCGILFLTLLKTFLFLLHWPA